MIDRRPIAMITCTSGNWFAAKRPEMNQWGYANWLRVADPVGALFNTTEQVLAMGFHAVWKGINGTGVGQDQTGAYPAMFPQIKADLEARLPAKIAEWKIKYPKQRVGVYTGSKWGSKGPNSLVCEEDPNVGTYTCDTRTDEAQAAFNTSNGMFIKMGMGILAFDKGTHTTRVEGARAANQFCAGLDAVGSSDVWVITEAIRDDADELPMMARTEFIHKYGLPVNQQEGAKHGPLWDKVWPVDATANRYWWMQLDYGVPQAGQAAVDFIKSKVDNGWVPVCAWPALASEIALVAATHPSLVWGR